MTPIFHNFFIWIYHHLIDLFHTYLILLIIICWPDFAVEIKCFLYKYYFLNVNLRLYISLYITWGHFEPQSIVFWVMYLSGLSCTITATGLGQWCGCRSWRNLCCTLRAAQEMGLWHYEVMDKSTVSQLHLSPLASARSSPATWPSSLLVGKRTVIQTCRTKHWRVNLSR